MHTPIDYQSLRLVRTKALTCFCCLLHSLATLINASRRRCISHVAQEQSPAIELVSQLGDVTELDLTCVLRCAFMDSAASTLCIKRQYLSQPDNKFCV